MVPPVPHELCSPVCVCGGVVTLLLHVALNEKLFPDWCSRDDDTVGSAPGGIAILRCGVFHQRLTHWCTEAQAMRAVLEAVVV